MIIKDQRPTQQEQALQVMQRLAEGRILLHRRVDQRQVREAGGKLILF